MWLIDGLLDSVRQMWFPSAFWIPRPESQASLLDEAERILLDHARVGTPPASGPEKGHVEEQFLARVATGLWRLRQRMVDPSSGQPRDEMRRTYRHLESLWDALAEFGVAIQDHGGEAFDAGMALIVLSYERDLAVSRETVKETVKPTVYLRDRCIQRGEVIVGSPDA